MMDDKPSAIGLATKVLQNGGVLGLIAVMGMAFQMYVVYRGQVEIQKLQMEILNLSQQSLLEEKKQTDIFTDVRYMLRANGGLTFRNTQE